MMTEDEAKTKWCPFARVNTTAEDSVTGRVTGINGGGNRMLTGTGFHDNPAQARCLGSTCMAWRWLEIGRLGYCGIAGRQP